MKSKDDINTDNNPPHDLAAKCEVYCFAALADQTTGTIYTDLTGRFPVRSLHGNQYIFWHTYTMQMQFWSVQ